MCLNSFLLRATGSWQLPLGQSSKEITAFQTPMGLFQCSVMPFGLVNASASFSRLMRKLLEGMQCIDNFIDDVISFTRTFREHVCVIKDFFTETSCCEPYYQT